MGFIHDLVKGKSKTKPLEDAPPHKDKSAMKGMSFDEGEAALSPKGDKGKSPAASHGALAQAAGLPAPKVDAPKPADAPKPKANADVPKKKPDDDAKPDKQVVDQGKDDDEDTGPSPADIRNYNKALTKWCVPGKDDPKTVMFLVDRWSTPDRLKQDQGLAKHTIADLKTKPEYARYQATMTDAEMELVCLYTTNAAYAMNAILRGQVSSSAWMNPFGKLTADVQKALAKVPQGARNMQNDTKIDDSLGDHDVVNLGEAFRADEWNPAFTQVFANEYGVGRGFEEPAFFSATVMKGSYNSQYPISRTITDVTVARSVADLSDKPKEKEALFPPGTRFRITSIEAEDTKTKQRLAVDDPKKLYPDADGGKSAFNRPGLAWHIKMKQIAVAKGRKAKKRDKKANADIAHKPKANLEQKGPGMLEKLLGIANVQS